jgi:hypothetical protein
MIYLLFQFLDSHRDAHFHYVPVLNLLRYLTFRTGLSFVTGYIVAVGMGSRFIRWMRTKQGKGQPIRTDGVERHLLEKKGTPTMGGFMILAGLMVGTLLWSDLTNIYVWVVLMVTAAYGGLGFMDDYEKVTKQTVAGVSSRMKLLVQFLVAAVAVPDHPLRPENARSGGAHLGRLPDLQGSPAEPRLVLCDLRHGVHRRLLQRGEPDRRPGRPRHRAGDDRSRRLRLHRLYRG